MGDYKIADKCARNMPYVKTVSLRGRGWRYSTEFGVEVCCWGSTCKTLTQFKCNTK
jgi:hypothetical protein